MKAIYGQHNQSSLLPTARRQQGNTDDGFMTMFGDILRQMRTEQGISLGQFALRVHYNKGYLSRIENGQKAPSEELARMCDAELGAPEFVKVGETRGC